MIFLFDRHLTALIKVSFTPLSRWNIVLGFLCSILLNTDSLNLGDQSYA